MKNISPEQYSENLLKELKNNPNISPEKLKELEEWKKEREKEGYSGFPIIRKRYDLADNAPMEGNPPVKAQENEIQLNRRNFLKILGIAGASLITGEIINKAYKILNNQSLDKENQINLNTTREVNLQQRFNNSQISPVENNSQKENKEEFKLADIFFQKFSELSCQEKYWPHKIFTPEFLIAIQLQETKFNPKAKSRKGAIGIMQNMDISIKDVARFLTILAKKGKIKYNGPSDLTKKQLKEIKKMIKENADYSRVFGKLFLMTLYHLYKVGQKEYQNGQTELTQKKLAACYNGGHSLYKKPEWRWPRESRHYAQKVMFYKHLLENIHSQLQKENIVSNQNYASMLIAKQAEKYKIRRNRIVKQYINKIKEIETKKGRPLNDEELRQLFI